MKALLILVFCLLITYICDAGKKNKNKSKNKWQKPNDLLKVVGKKIKNVLLPRPSQEIDNSSNETPPPAAPANRK